MPKDKLWISLEEEESWPSWIALPGHKNLGLGRHWHFSSMIFWFANGVAYYTLLFASGEWVRLVPTSWNVIPEAIKAAMTYATFNFPPPGDPYNAFQQLDIFWSCLLAWTIYDCNRGCHVTCNSCSISKISKDLQR